MKGFLARLASFIRFHPGICWVVLALLSVPPLLGWMGFSLRERGRASWRSAADISELSEARNSFSFEGWPVVLLLEADDLLTLGRLQAIRTALEDLEAMEAVDRIVWIDKIPPLQSQFPDSEEALSSYRNLVLQHPLSADQLIDSQGRAMLIGVIPSGAYRHEDAERMQQLVLGHVESQGVNVHVTGIFPLQGAQWHAMSREHFRIVGTACVLVVALALILFRGFSAISIAVAGPALGFVWVEGWLWFSGEPSNQLVNLILPIMVIVIGFTDSVHLVVHIREARGEGLSQPEAAESAVKEVGFACLMTSVTTAIGFASLMLTSAAIILGFGRASAVGVMITFVAVITVVPLMSMTFLGRRIHFGRERDLVAVLIGWVEPVLKPIIKHARLVSLASVALLLALIYTASDLRPDDRLSLRIPRTSEAFQGLTRSDQSMGGIMFLQVVVEWPEGASATDIWNRIEAVEKILAKEPTLRTPLSIRHWMSLLPGKESPLKLMLAEALPVEVRSRFWNSEERRALVVARMQDLGIAHYDPVLERLRQEFLEIEDESANNREARIFATGQFVVMGRTVRRVVRELMLSLLLASGVIFVVMSFAYRSLALGLLSLIPNLIPLAATAAIRSSLDNSLDISSACAFTVCLGLAVDDTIHFLSRYLLEREEGADVEHALERTFRSVGSALVMTTVVMLAGFVSVMTSQMQTHKMFALTASITVTGALIADLFFLPGLLAAFPFIRGKGRTTSGHDDGSELL